MGALATKMEDPTEDHPWFKRGNPFTLLAMAMLPIFVAFISILMLAFVFRTHLDFEEKTAWLNIASCAVYAIPIAFIVHMKFKGAIIGVLAWAATMWMLGIGLYLMPMSLV